MIARLSDLPNTHKYNATCITGLFFYVHHASAKDLPDEQLEIAGGGPGAVPSNTVKELKSNSATLSY